MARQAEEFLTKIGRRGVHAALEFVELRGKVPGLSIAGLGSKTSDFRLRA